VHDRFAVRDLIAIAKNQQEREQFRDAWTTLAEASKIEETGSWLIDTGALHAAEEDLAMAWLENARTREGETFADIAGKVEPVLERGQSSAAPQRKADLLAHLGCIFALARAKHGP
jgi:hypothetical protein